MDGALSIHHADPMVDKKSVIPIHGYTRSGMGWAALRFSRDKNTRVSQLKPHPYDLRRDR
jgi:hypothetical protein